MNIIEEVAIREFENKHPNQLFLDPDFEVAGPVRIIEMAQRARRMSNALLAIVNGDVSLSEELKTQALETLGIKE